MWFFVWVLVLYKSYYEYIYDKNKIILFSKARAKLLRTFMICFKDFAYILRTPFFTTPVNGYIQNNLPDTSNFLVRFVKAICRNCLSFYDGDNTFQRHSVSSISSSIFSILFDFAIFTPPNLNFFSTSTFS